MNPTNYKTCRVKTVGVEDIYTFYGCQISEDGKTFVIEHTVPHGTPAYKVHRMFDVSWSFMMKNFGGTP